MAGSPRWSRWDGPRRPRCPSRSPRSPCPGTSSSSRTGRPVAAGVASPALLEAFLQLPGAHDDEIAAANRDALRRRTGVELGIGDAVAVFQAGHLVEAGDVEQHAAADHLVARMLDAELAETVAVDHAGVVAVVHRLLV